MLFRGAVRGCVGCDDFCRWRSGIHLPSKSEQERRVVSSSLKTENEMCSIRRIPPLVVDPTSFPEDAAGSRRELHPARPPLHTAQWEMLHTKQES